MEQSKPQSTDVPIMIAGGPASQDAAIWLIDFLQHLLRDRPNPSPDGGPGPFSSWEPTAEDYDEGLQLLRTQVKAKDHKDGWLYCIRAVIGFVDLLIPLTKERMPSTLKTGRLMPTHTITIGRRTITVKAIAADADVFVGKGFGVWQRLAEKRLEILNVEPRIAALQANYLPPAKRDLILAAWAAVPKPTELWLSDPTGFSAEQRDRDAMVFKFPPEWKALLEIPDPQTLPDPLVRFAGEAKASTPSSEHQQDLDDGGPPSREAQAASSKAIDYYPSPAAAHWIYVLKKGLQLRFPPEIQEVRPWMRWASGFTEKRGATIKKHGPTPDDFDCAAEMLQRVGWLQGFRAIVGFVNELDPNVEISVRQISSNVAYLAAAGTRLLFRTKEKREYIKQEAQRRAKETSAGLASPDLVRRNLETVCEEIGFPRHWRYMLELPLEQGDLDLLPDPHAQAMSSEDAKVPAVGGTLVGRDQVRAAIGKLWGKPNITTEWAMKLFKKAGMIRNRGRDLVVDLPELTAKIVALKASSGRREQSSVDPNS